ncbi:ABC transporter ATP-binding protein [Cupriavidus necator]|uniref:ABC transporter ATP-binding protein n=1 Tax=Cupriavidus necator TaxID=106590 RepID=UPI0027815A1D|nr:ABC transporter ATP-binding protein [Cupriavidus necator]MDQ0143791.1 branched-chain amino acid transport system ATP-binding protein [Cupriavidus necator]
MTATRSAHTSAQGVDSAPATALAAALSRPRPGVAQLEQLAGGTPMVAMDNVVAGYGGMEILHGFSLRVARGGSLCLIGPNGAGKSTVLRAIYGLARVMSGSIAVAGAQVVHLHAEQKLRQAGVAYVLQESSIFPDMTVEENLLMGGYLMPRPRDAAAAAERIFRQHGVLAQRRGQRASVLSGGERRLLEILRALMMDPAVLLVDEPSIGLEPRYIDLVFELLGQLQHEAGKTIILVEQNARKGLAFADLGYVLVAGQLAMAGTGGELSADPEVGRLFLGA